MENDCTFVNKDVEDYIAQWPHPRFDGTSIAAQLRTSSGVTSRLYSDVHHIWSRLQAADDRVTILRKAVSETLDELNSVLEA